MSCLCLADNPTASPADSRVLGAQRTVIPEYESVKVLFPAPVTPAEAGVQRLSSESAWIPAFAGMTRRNLFIYGPYVMDYVPLNAIMRTYYRLTVLPFRGMIPA